MTPDMPAMDEKDRVQGMVRSMDQWRNMVPVAVADGSMAQVEYALIDAKHDIEALWQFALLSLKTVPEVEAVAWQPIETAPNDGSEFLVWFPTQREIGYGFHVKEGYGYPAAFRFFWFDIEEAADANEPDERPSLWRPLPATPQPAPDAEVKP